MENHGQRNNLQTFREKNCSRCDLEKFYIIFKPELASLSQKLTGCQLQTQKKVFIVQQLARSTDSIVRPMACKSHMSHGTIAENIIIIIINVVFQVPTP